MDKCFIALLFLVDSLKGDVNMAKISKEEFEKVVSQCFVMKVLETCILRLPFVCVHFSFRVHVLQSLHS